jgi:transcriptional regulator with XRE-family HTH domain
LDSVYSLGFVTLYLLRNIKHSLVDSIRNFTFAKKNAMKTVADRIKKLRELKNLTQEHMANELGVSQNTYSRLETESTKITIDRLEEIASILEVPVEMLLKSDAPIYNISNNTNHKYIGYFENIEDKESDFLMKQLEFLQQEVQSLRKENQALLDVIKNITNKGK